MDMMADFHGPDYEFCQLFCGPSDVGHSACSRERTYVVGSHQERTSMLHDPWEVQENMRKEIMKRAFTYPSDYLIATETEVQLEAQEKARSRGIQYIPGETNLYYLLTPREKAALAEYELEYWVRHQSNMMWDEDMFVFLGDNPSYSLTWSFYGKLPTYRMNSRSSILWNAKHKRWLTGKERLCSLGWPVIQSVADSMDCPMIPALDVKRSSDLAGNGMHMLNTGAIQCIALACFGSSSSLAMLD